MNTIFKVVSIGHKNAMLLRHALCFICMFLITAHCYSQPGKKPVDLGKIYEAQLKEHLFPKIDSLGANDVVLFVTKPSFSAEYSIRVIEHGGQSFIEARFLEKNLGDEIHHRLIKHDEKPFSVNVNVYSAPISNHFKKRMITAFTKVISNKQISKVGEYEELAVDGIVYEFYTFNKKEMGQSKKVNSPEVGTMEDNMIKILIQLSDDLKTQSFDEANYIEGLKLKSF